jgi:hypothetical protein
MSGIEAQEEMWAAVSPSEADAHFVNYEALERASADELDEIIRDGGPSALIDAATAERIRRRAASYAPSEEELEIAGAFDGFTVTSDADPGL